MIGKFGMSRARVGKFFNRDHTTVLYWLRKAEKLAKADTVEAEHLHLLLDICDKALADFAANRGFKPGMRLFQDELTPPARQPSLWTNVELKILTDGYPHLSDISLQALLPGRSLGGIKGKAEKLKLRKLPRVADQIETPVEAPVAELRKARPANVIGIRRITIIDSPSKAVGRVDDAARHLRRIAPVYRCNDEGRATHSGKLWRYGNRIMTDAALVELAERKGWRRFDELAA
jgi:hypothetical protein